MKKPIDVQFTKEGFEKLKADYQDLLRRRPGVVERLTAAREQGDLSENAGYHAAKEELSQIDSRLRQMKLMMRFGEVVESDGEEIVSFGKTVVVANGENSMEFMIVGKLEANPLKGKLSDASPIGSALLGKKPGDKVCVETPGGEITYKILKVNS